MSRNTSFVVATTRGRPIYIQPGRTAGTRKTIDKKHRALRTRTWLRAVFEPIQMIAQVMHCSVRAVEYQPRRPSPTRRTPRPRQHALKPSLRAFF